MGAVSIRSEAVQRLRLLIGRRQARWQSRRFVVEGPKLLAEALAAGVAPEVVYLDAGAATGAHWDLARRAVGAAIIEVAPGVLARVCDAVTPQPIAAIVPMIDVAMGEPLEAIAAAAPEGGTAVVLAGVQDPGNAGSIVRSAWASAAGAVVFCAGAVDMYNPKTVRASAGALFHVPVVAGPEPALVLDALAGFGLRRLATVARGGQDYTTVDLAVPAALVLGSESHGLAPELAGGLDGQITIPMSPGAESLNVAMAATVLCFEAARQRRQRLARPEQILDPPGCGGVA